MSTACNALRYVKYSLPIETPKIIYFAHIHTIMSCGVIFWGNLLLLFTVDIKHLFTANNEIHKYNTRNNNNRHPALTNLRKYSKGPYVSDIKVFNHLSQYLKAVVLNPKHFRSSLKRFLYHHSFHCMEEYYEYKENTL